MKRTSGILLPVSSLPSEYGIGCFSKEAYEFVDNLEKSGQSYWQILPLGPTGYGDSPYQSFSTFAGNPYFIDLENLIARGWLTKEECDSKDFTTNFNYIEYYKIYSNRFDLLRTAFQNSNIQNSDAFQAFNLDNAFWLDDYALFMAIKDSFGGISWTLWDTDYRLHDTQALAAFQQEHESDILFYKFQQFMFSEQWNQLKSYANQKNIKIIGDIPIYVAFDSADSWAMPQLFQFTEEGEPIGVAGCPPDAFALTGQLWGNPLYNWDYHEQTDYQWWIKRVKYCFKLYDLVRIDHFRGFEAYYSIPYGDDTAENGTWVKGPGMKFFHALNNHLGKLDIIAEDLGFLTPEVYELLSETGYPGMKVLQFAFDDSEDSTYLPHKYKNNCVVYTGTHDNDTSLGWYRSLDTREREFVDTYLNLNWQNSYQANFSLIRAAFMSAADLAVVPMQDFLSLGSEARINIPSTLGNNWKWRMSKDDFSETVCAEIKKLTKLYGRLQNITIDTE